MATQKKKFYQNGNIFYSSVPTAIDKVRVVE